MKVIPIVPRGYCKGVVRAINIAKDSIDKYPLPIHILGMIVHNQYIVDALSQKGIITVEDPLKDRETLLDQITSGTVIITAHGCDDKVINKAKEKGLNVIDATCKDVIKTHDLIKDYLKQGYEVLYIGKDKHPEAMGSIAIDKNHIHLIQNATDIDKLDQDKKYVITNQTTMSIYDIYHLFEYAKKHLTNVEIAPETCNATKIRQEALSDIDNEVEAIFIVGDNASNNTKKLATIASSKNDVEVFMINSVEDIDTDRLIDYQVVAVTSGASTPTYLTNQVISYLEQFDYSNRETYSKPEIELDKII